MTSIKAYNVDTRDFEYVRMNDSGLLISGGGSGGSDSSAANQLTQIQIAEDSNIALFNQLSTQTDRLLYDLDLVVNRLHDIQGTVSVDNQITGFATSQLQTESNIALCDRLNLVSQGVELSADYLQSLFNVTNPLKIQKSKYTIDAVEQFAPGQVPQFSKPPSGILPETGWYFKNTGTNQPSQMYYYSWLNPQLSPATRQKSHQLGTLVSGWAKVRILSMNNTAGLPMLGIYTQPQGTGDFIPGFARSRRVYTIPTGANITQGQEVLIYYGVVPNTNLYPECARVEMQLTLSNGPLLNTELVGYLSVNTDSGATAGNAEYIISAAGVQFAGDIILDSEFTGESSSQVSATSANQLASNTAVCARLDTQNLLSNTIVQLLGDNIPVINYGLMNDTPQYVPIRASSSGNLFVYDGEMHNLISPLVAFDRLQCENQVTDGKLDTVINNMSLTSFHVNNLTKCDTDNIVVPGGVAINGTVFVEGVSTCNTNDVSISNFPAIQTVSLAGENLTVSDSTTHTELGNIRTFIDKLVVDIKSPETTGALLVKVDNQLSQPFTVISDSKTQDGEGNIITSTQEGTSKRGLDVNLINKNQIGYSQISTDSAITNTGPIGSLADTQGYLYTGIQFQVSNWSTQGGGHSYDHPVYIQFSGDGSLWTNGNSVTVSGNNTYSITVSGVNPFRYVRLYADMGTHQPTYTVNAWLSQK